MENNEDRDSRPARPRRVRRSGGFRPTNSTEAYGAQGEGDSVDAAVEPTPDFSNLNGAVRRRAQSPVAVLPPSNLPAIPPPVTQETTAQRLSRVGRLSSEYEYELRLRLIHRMTIEGYSLDEIATELNLSLRQIKHDRAELGKRFRNEARTLDIDFIIGQGQGFYEEAQSMAMRIASDDRTPIPMKLAAIRTGLGANADRSRFLQATGVFDALRYRQVGEAAGQSDMERLMEATQRIFSADAPAPNPAPGFSLNDQDSNGSDEEHVEL